MEICDTAKRLIALGALGASILCESGHRYIALNDEGGWLKENWGGNRIGSDKRLDYKQYGGVLDALDAVDEFLAQKRQELEEGPASLIAHYELMDYCDDGLLRNPQ